MSANLIRLLVRLPGVGEATAERFAKSIADQPEDYRLALARAIEDHGRPTPCRVCGDDCDGERCPSCSRAVVSPGRILVVKSVKAREAVDATSRWAGRTHVLRGLIDPMHGIGPAQLTVRQLLERMRGDEVQEVTLALGGSEQARSTASYLSDLLGPLGVGVWEIGLGVAYGSLLEDADPAAIITAIAERRAVR